MILNGPGKISIMVGGQVVGMSIEEIKNRNLAHPERS